jgi:transposase
VLELSYRQAKRLWQRYREEGAKGLQHRSAGRSSNRSKPEKFRRKVLQLIRKKYSGTEQERFGPTLAAEHLADEDGLEVGEETLRRWMLAEGLWSRMRRRKAHRKRRERRQHFGDLVQLDGRFHAWFEERGPRGCLVNMVDDATTRTCCRLGEQETIWAAVGVLRSWIGKYGVPRALYTDWKNVYKRQPERTRAVAGESANDAVWTHVRAIRDSHYCGQFTASERAGGTPQRGPSRSSGEETASPGDPGLRSCE